MTSFTQRRPVGELSRWGVVDILFLSMLGGFWWWSQGATVDQLRWLLQPTVWFVSAVTGQAFGFVAGQGFVRSDGQVLIHEGCAGLTFLTMAAAVAWTHLLSFPRGRTKLLLWLGLGLLAPVALTLFANTSRILLSLRLEHIPLAQMLSLSEGGVHLAVGMVTYLTMLMLFSFALRRSLHVIQTH